MLSKEDIELIKTMDGRLTSLEEAMNKMQTCALVMKGIVQKSTGVDIDAAVKKEMEK
jgi:hypothetical protein